MSDTLQFCCVLSTTRSALSASSLVLALGCKIYAIFPGIHRKTSRYRAQQVTPGNAPWGGRASAGSELHPSGGPACGTVRGRCLPADYSTGSARTLHRISFPWRVLLHYRTWCSNSCVLVNAPPHYPHLSEPAFTVTYAGPCCLVKQGLEVYSYRSSYGEGLAPAAEHQFLSFPMERLYVWLFREIRDRPKNYQEERKVLSLHWNVTTVIIIVCIYFPPYVHLYVS